jgi:hypothetical protein
MSVSEDVLDQARMQQMETREEEVDSMIRSNRYASAVQVALSNPPLGTKNADIKVRKKHEKTSLPFFSFIIIFLVGCIANDDTPSSLLVGLEHPMQ